MSWRQGGHSRYVFFTRCSLSSAELQTVRRARSWFLRAARVRQTTEAPSKRIRTITNSPARTTTCVLRGRTGYNCLPGREHMAVRSAHSCPPELSPSEIPISPGPSQGALSEVLFLTGVLRPRHPGGDLGHVCPTARANAHLFPTREPEKGGIQVTAFPRPRYWGWGMDSGRGHPGTFVSWTRGSEDSPKQRLMHSSLER